MINRGWLNPLYQQSSQYERHHDIVGISQTHRRDEAFFGVAGLEWPPLRAAWQSYLLKVRGGRFGNYSVLAGVKRMLSRANLFAVAAGAPTIDEPPE